jgi:hypothetical protein
VLDNGLSASNTLGIIHDEGDAGSNSYSNTYPGPSGQSSQPNTPPSSSSLHHQAHRSPSPHQFTFPRNVSPAPTGPPSSAGSATSSAGPHNASFLFPTAGGPGGAFNRSRSKSDPPLPVWDTPDGGMQTQQPNSAGMNVDSMGSMQDQYLSADGLGPGLALRRSRSGGPAPGHNRGSRSEDFRGAGGLLTVPGMLDTSSGEGGGGAGQFLSPGGNDPPPSIRQGFGGGGPNSLGLGFGGRSPQLGTQPLPGQGGGPGYSSPGMGHIRRGSSGSVRSERGTSAGYGGGAESFAHRSSPYPSPHPSPRGRYDDLPREDGGLGLMDGGGGGGGGMYGHGGHGHHSSIGSLSGLTSFSNLGPHSQPVSSTHTPSHSPSHRPSPLPSIPSLPPTHGGGPSSSANSPPLANGGPGMPSVVTVGSSTVPLVVTKQNVTTGRTAKASHIRRKQEATFVCPVPGCGSTFTRSFNLKGGYYYLIPYSFFCFTFGLY